jgi:hypothetical protein
MFDECNETGGLTLSKEESLRKTNLETCETIERVREFM